MTAADETPDDAAPPPGGQPGLVPSADSPLLPYGDLRAPRPAPAAPPPPARWLAFAGIVLGGLLGGLIGWGVADLLSEGALWPAVGGLVGGVAGAVGVGIIAGLTLQAMNEWRSVRHPEAE
jgi:uncharacterized membrane protein YedE/YeeE